MIAMHLGNCLVITIKNYSNQSIFASYHENKKSPVFLSTAYIRLLYQSWDLFTELYSNVCSVKYLIFE